MELKDLPRYRSHKIIQAAKIERVYETGRRVTLIVEGDVARLDIIVPDAFFARGPPKPGDWFMLYPDGYQSWSPAAQFVDGYTRLSP